LNLEKRKASTYSYRVKGVLVFLVIYAISSWRENKNQILINNTVTIKINYKNINLYNNKNCNMIYIVLKKKKKKSVICGCFRLSSLTSDCVSNFSLIPIKATNLISA